MRLFIFLTGLFLTITASSQKKLALIVAIGEYPANSGCPPIASLNDVKYIKSALKKNLFAEKDIDTLKNNKATKAGIIKGLDALINKATKNDIVVIHFACHGQQIQDQPTTALGKDEADGYDEALLAYDAKARYNPMSYRGENHLRDDELGIKLTAIRNKIGINGSLLVLIDACHSGTASRADEFTVSRGEPVPFPDPENPIDSLISLSSTEEESTFIGKESDTVANMVVISGSGPHQKNFQTRVGEEDVGSLSFAFAKAIDDLPPGSDYLTLFQKIKARIQADHPAQLPLIEGKTNQIVFSGKYAEKQDKIILKQGVRDIPFSGDTVFTIEKGTLHNIAQGSACKIYLLNSKEPFTEGKIIRAGNFFSIGISAKPLKKQEAYEVKMEELNYGDFSASIMIKTRDQLARSLLLEKHLKDLIKPYRFLSLSNNADMMIDLQADKNGTVKINLVDISDSVHWEKQITGDTLTKEDARDLLYAIKNAIRVRYLRGMSDGGDLAAGISAEIFPRDSSVTITSELVLQANDRYVLKIKNNSDHTLYYTIINIMPDNKAKVLIPGPDQFAGDYTIRGKDEKQIRLRVDAEPALGRELFKIIVSKQELDIRNIFARKATRANLLSFEEALNDMFKDNNDAGATRAEISNVSVEEIGIVTVGFTVKNRK